MQPFPSLACARNARHGLRLLAVARYGPPDNVSEPANADLARATRCHEPVLGPGGPRALFGGVR